MTRIARYRALRLLAVTLLLSVRPLTIAVSVIAINQAPHHSGAAAPNSLTDGSNALVIGRPLAWLTQAATYALNFVTAGIRFAVLCASAQHSDNRLKISA